MRPHKKLEVWKESMILVKRVYEFVVEFPEDEKYGLVSQLKRAAVSVPTNIAEGAARNTNREFRQFLYISRGSLSEIDTLIQLSFDLGFIDEKLKVDIVSSIDKITAMQNGLIKSLTS